MKPKILITGGNGLLGRGFIPYQEKYDIYFLSKNSKNSMFKRHTNLDMLDQICFETFLNNENFDTIIHAAAETNVDYCERYKEIAYETNVSTTIFLSDYCKKRNIKLIFISSDQLFDGEKEFYKETDALKPLNYYGLSKCESEVYIKSCGIKSLILRTNFFCDGFRQRVSFSDFIKKEEELNLFSDVFFSPVHRDVLVELILFLHDENASGVFNISCDERISKYDFGKRISKILNLNKNINESSVDSSNLYAKRPKSMALSNEKIKKIFDNHHILNLDYNIKMLKKG